MKRTFDLFACFPLQDDSDLAQLKKGFKANPAMHGRLLSAALGEEKLVEERLKEKSLKENARVDYRSLVHQRGHKSNAYEQQVIAPRLKMMNDLKLLDPNPGEALSHFPVCSFFLQIRFTLSKPYLSRDDEAFYIIDNPLKKEKVFSVPYIAPASWKGNLRWTTMYMRIALPLAEKKRELLDSVGEARAQEEYKAYAAELAEERLRHTLLFGSEQGWQEDRADGWTKYLDDLMKTQAKEKYRELLRKHFKVSKKDPIPHSQGRLQFFPTYLDRIDLEVINPHDRKTRTGKQPIYFEVSPAGAKGVFSLLYTPFDLVGNENTPRTTVQKDLETVIEGVRGMLCEYGFSAKKSSGFGVADPNSIAGRLDVNDPGWDERGGDWESFDELRQLTRQWQEVAR